MRPATVAVWRAYWDLWEMVVVELMVVGDGRMDVDVDVVMLVCGCEPGKGPLPGRAQPEVRHCSVTW